MDAREDIFIAGLRGALAEEDVETSLAPNLGGEHKGAILRALLPLPGTSVRVLTDTALTALTPEYDLVHIHTTIILKVGSGAEALRAAAAQWNESCPLGAFNVNSSGSFVHRFTFPADTAADGAELARRTLDMLHLLSALFRQYYPEAAKLSWPGNT